MYCNNGNSILCKHSEIASRLQLHASICYLKSYFERTLCGLCTLGCPQIISLTSTSYVIHIKLSSTYTNFCQYRKEIIDWSTRTLETSSTLLNFYILLFVKSSMGFRYLDITQYLCLLHTLY